MITEKKNVRPVGVLDTKLAMIYKQTKMIFLVQVQNQLTKNIWFE